MIIFTTILCVHCCAIQNLECPELHKNSLKFIYVYRVLRPILEVSKHHENAFFEIKFKLSRKSSSTYKLENVQNIAMI